jgi:hypothetical protein
LGQHGLDYPECIVANFPGLEEMLTRESLGLADVLCFCFLVLDTVSRMALDPHSLFRTTWPGDANEAA